MEPKVLYEVVSSSLTLIQPCIPNAERVGSFNQLYSEICGELKEFEWGVMSFVALKWFWPILTQFLISFYMMRQVGEGGYFG